MNLRSLFGKKPNLPYWAQGVKQQDYDNLLNAIRTYFKDHGTEVEVNEFEGTATPSSGPLAEQTLGLHNLIRIIPGMKSEDVQKFVNGHFGKFLDMGIEQERIENGSYDDVKKHLRIRIFYTEPHNPEDPLYTFPGIQLCETLKACPMFDLEHSAVTLSKEKFESWNVPIEEVHQLALDQTFAEIERTEPLQKLDFSDGKPVVLMSEECIYFASIALDFERFVPVEPRCGYLVCIPSRQSLLIHPLSSPDSTKSVQKILEAACQMFEDSVGKVGVDGYWVKGNQFLRLEFGQEGGETPNLAALAKCLAKGD